MSVEDKLKSEGWELITTSVYLKRNGPIFRKQHDHENWRYALITGEHHANIAGRVHGGMIMTFADYVLGMTAYEQLARQPSVTVQLNTNLIASAKIGELIEGEATVVSHVKDIVFMRGKLTAGDRTIATADGVWRIVAKP